jgi:formyltetrahydrofolate-dependent phosphoribosylglycinamide formyltransferase
MGDTVAKQVSAYTDGASRGNPGPAAAGFVLCDGTGKQLQAKAFCIGQATNNVAEYTAVLRALDAAQELGADAITILTDSELLARQLNGQYRVKSEQIRPLYCQAIDTLAKFSDWTVRHVPREQNKGADEMVNRALDQGRDIQEQGDGLKRRGVKCIRLGVLISGGGRTLMNILDCIRKGRLNAEVSVVISSRSDVAGVEKAEKAGLKVVIIRKKEYPDIDQFSKRIEEELVAANAELVVQGGWLCLWKIPGRFVNRVMNIHPALLPSFGGQGMWGHHVHEAVLKAGCKVSGCTVHFCTDEYDSGPIIIQRTCQVRDDDTPDSLAERVFEQECIAYPQAIELFAQGRLQVREGRVIILP